MIDRGWRSPQRAPQEVHQLITWAFYCLATVSPPLCAEDYLFAQIDVPNSESTEARGINDQGDIVGSYFSFDGVRHGFLLRDGVFSSIDVPDAAITLGARAINAWGDIVGSFQDSSLVQHGYLLRNGKFTQIDYPDAGGTFATGINDAGDITGSYLGAAGDQNCFIFRDGVFDNLLVPGSSSCQVHSVQGDGRMPVGHARMQFDGGFHGFAMTGVDEFQLIDFPGLPIPCTAARWINQRGDIVGFFVESDNADECLGRPSHGFLLRDGRYTRIDVPGSEDAAVLAINDDGVIVGRFTDVNGNGHGFKAVPAD